MMAVCDGCLQCWLAMMRGRVLAHRAMLHWPSPLTLTLPCTVACWSPQAPRLPYLARGRWCEWWVTRLHAWVATRLTSPASRTSGLEAFVTLVSSSHGLACRGCRGPGLLGGSTDRQEEIGGSPLSSVSPVPCLPTFLPLVSPSPLDQGRLLLICRWPGSVLSSSLPQILSAARPSSFLLTSRPSSGRGDWQKAVSLLSFHHK